MPCFKGEAINTRCRACCPREAWLGKTGEKSSGWKGGRGRASGGYIKIKLQPDDFFYPTADKRGYIMEHRLVVAKALGRNLHLWEIVHHKDNCPKDDNRYPETLQLVTEDGHTQITRMETRISYLEKRITLLEAENILLRGGNEANALKKDKF